MLITDLLRQNAQQYPGESALVSVDTKNLIPDQPDSYEACRRTLTWKQFDALANRIANYLLHMGIRKGSKVGIMMMNRIEYLPLFFGILRAGAVSTQINFRYRSSELVQAALLTDIEVLFYDSSSQAAIAEAQPALLQLRASQQLTTKPKEYTMLH